MNKMRKILIHDHIKLMAALTISIVFLIFPSFKVKSETPVEVPVRLISGGEQVSVTFENDWPWHDRHYTHGTRFFWLNSTNQGYILAQLMYTPSDIAIKELIPNDRPYGGWLYLGFVNYDIRPHKLTLTEFDVGVVGPLSFAEEVQTFTHKYIFHCQIPMGWDNQLHNEPGINYRFQRYLSYLYNSHFNLVLHYGGILGNVFTHANAGINCQLGYNVKENFGTDTIVPTISPKKALPLSIYFILGLDARLVLHNIFLDGNTFVDSHKVDSLPAVSDFKAGLGMSYKQVSLDYIVTIRSHEFTLQEDSSTFGSLELKWLF